MRSNDPLGLTPLQRAQSSLAENLGAEAADDLVERIVARKQAEAMQRLAARHGVPLRVVVEALVSQ